MRPINASQIRSRTFTQIVALMPFILLAPQAPSQAPPPSPTMRQLMLDLIYPASNDILLTISRGEPSDEKQWASLRHSALTLSESGAVLIAQNQSASGAWSKAAKMLADAGADAYNAAQAKDAKAFQAIVTRIDASCTNCHRQFRPNVFPRQGEGQ